MILTRKEVLAEWESFFIEKQAEDYVSLTIRFPFCYSVCDFCMHVHRPLIKRREIVDWLNLLNKEMRYFSKTFSHYRIKGFYLCGGTISIMTNDELKKLSDIILNNFTIDQGSVFRFIETSVENLSFEKIDFYKSLPLNINRIGIGVQCFNDSVLRKHGRFISSNNKAEKLDIIKYANSLFPMCYVDFIHGLEGKDIRFVVADVMAVMQHCSVGRIDIYMLWESPNLLKSIQASEMVFFNEEERNIEKIKFKDFFYIMPQVYQKYDIFLRGSAVVLRRKDVLTLETFISPNPHLYNSSLSFGALAYNFIIPRRFHYSQHITPKGVQYMRTPHDFSMVCNNRDALSLTEKEALIHTYAY